MKFWCTCAPGEQPQPSQDMHESLSCHNVQVDNCELSLADLFQLVNI